ncbi:MAG: hypothetical protein KDA28_09065, partial [Phycisphaerales bacterium]|nr:hypothetical protein [Phycisphaerales bacterium]
EYIEDSVNDAVEEYLDEDYPAECAAEFARQRLDCSIMAERLRHRDADEIEGIIRREATEEMRHMIDVTLGEYISDGKSEVAIDFDAEGLANWARNRFGVEIDPTELGAGDLSTRRAVQESLSDAAERKIKEADLSGIAVFMEEDYGARQFSNWSRQKFGIEIEPQAIMDAIEDEDGPKPGDLVLDRAREMYHRREIEYPVDFAMEMTMVMMRQSPAEATGQLVNWANRRFELGWGDEALKQPPNKVREQLLEASAAFVEANRMQQEIDIALAIEDDAALEAYFQQRYGVGLPDSMRYLDEEDRPKAIRARVENLLRAELLYFERAILLDTLDSAWKDHLYGMDQLRDTINFRAFSQQDPRIAYKREGSSLYGEMLESVRDRVTDYVFKARISPAAQMQQQRPAPRPAPNGSGSGSISGPGMEVSGGMYEA